MSYKLNFKFTYFYIFAKIDSILYFNDIIPFQTSLSRALVTMRKSFLLHNNGLARYQICFFRNHRQSCFDPISSASTELAGFRMVINFTT